MKWTHKTYSTTKQHNHACMNHSQNKIRWTLSLAQVREGKKCTTVQKCLAHSATILSGSNASHQY